jgi:hypothetical protein
MNTDEWAQQYFLALQMWKDGGKAYQSEHPEPDPKDYHLTTEADLWYAWRLRKEVLGA